MSRIHYKYLILRGRTIWTFTARRASERLAQWNFGLPIVIKLSSCLVCVTGRFLGTPELPPHPGYTISKKDPILMKTHGQVMPMSELKKMTLASTAFTKGK